MNLLDQNVPQQQSTEPTPSEFQTAIYKFIREEEHNLQVEAVAGSGKTTTIVKAMDFAEAPALFLAFNKTIATEIGNRITRGESKTLNALGHRIVMQNWPKAQLNANRVRDAVKQSLSWDDETMNAYAISRSIGLAKALALGCAEQPAVSPEALAQIMDDFDLGVPSDNLGVNGEAAYSTWQFLAKDTLSFDFDDQLYLPVLNGWDFPQPRTVFIDEDQDLSPIQMEMLSAMSSSRKIGVGDRYQAIYGFRGASHTSIDELKRRFAMAELPLSISYRCPQSVVFEAQKLCPHIMYKEGAPFGLVQNRVEQLDEDDFVADPEWFEPGQLILCRNNAPLFRNILRYIRARKPCVVLSNFLDSFQSWIRSFRKQYCRDLLPRLDAWYEKERSAALERGAGKAKMAALRDKWETAKMLCQGFERVDELLSMLKTLSEGRTGPIFSTIHKAKGLEARKVYLLRPDLCPAPWVEPDSDQYQQEKNLLYVAITRAKEELIYGVSQI